MRRTLLRLGSLLLIGLAATAAPAAARGAQPDLDLGELHVSTFTDTLPGQAAADFQARAGDPVRRVYILRNDGLLPLVHIAVRDPDTTGATLSCGPDSSATVSALGPLSWAACSVTFAAVPGRHHTTVTATATSPILGHSITAQTTAGYTAVAPGLRVNLTFGSGSGSELPANSDVPTTVTLTNTGSVELRDLAPVDPQPLSGFDCGSGDPALDGLDAGGSAVCTGTLVTTPGKHSGTLTIAGAWAWARPITSQGPVSPRVFAVQAVADASYTGVLPPAGPPSPQPRSAGSPPPAVAPPPTPTQTSPGAVPPSPGPSASPSPTTRPSRPRSPTPGPSQSQSQGRAVLAAMPQYPASHGLSLPLKVLAIIIVPAIAVGRRATSSLGRH